MRQIISSVSLFSFHDFVKLIVFNFALSLVTRVGKEAALLIEFYFCLLASSKNAVLPWHEVSLLLGMLVVINLQALFTMKIVHLGSTLDGVNLVVVKCSSTFGLVPTSIVVHFAPLEHPLGARVD